MWHIIAIILITLASAAALLALGIAFLVSDLGGRCLERLERGGEQK